MCGLECRLRRLELRGVAAVVRFHAIRVGAASFFSDARSFGAGFAGFGGGGGGGGGSSSSSSSTSPHAVRCGGAAAAAAAAAVTGYAFHLLLELLDQLGRLVELRRELERAARGGGGLVGAVEPLGLIAELYSACAASFSGHSRSASACS